MPAYVKAISYYLPEVEITNEQLAAEFPEWDVAKISSKVGISSRYVTDKDEFTADIAVKAAKQLIDEYNLSPTAFDVIMLCTQTPDYFLPATACIVQDRLGLSTRTAAFDFNQGCSGYIYGLAMAKGFIAAGIAKNVLLITAETYSKHIHPRDKGNRTVFGDAASATWISGENGWAEIGAFELGTDGSGANNLIVKNGAGKSAKSNQEILNEEDIAASGDYLYMNGPEVFNFTIKSVPQLVNSTLEANNLSMDQVDEFLFHQANKYMLDHLRKKIGIPQEKFLQHMEYCGNTVSSTIPIALKAFVSEGRFRKEQTLLLAGFGVGYSWGGTVLKF